MKQLTKFNSALAQSCLSTIPKSVKYQVFYNPLSSNIALNPDRKNVVIFNYDAFTSGSNEYEHWIGGPSPLSKTYLEWVEKNPNHSFVFVLSGERADLELQHSRIQTVPFVSGMTNQQVEYQQLVPTIDKNFDSEKTFISLNRHPRQSRINLVSYLLGSDLEKYGIISFGDTIKCDTWLQRVSWPLTKQQEITIKPKLMKGYEKSKILDLTVSLKNVNDIYSAGFTDNATNFDQSLRHLYRNCFIEIVSETACNILYMGVSEKFLNSVYGCNFPIVIGSVGLVEFLSQMGFDMFDDIINHDYSQIQDPLDRICSAIDLNYELLTDSSRIQKLWRNSQHRFEQNINFARYNMYDWYRSRCLLHFSKVTWQ